MRKARAGSRVLMVSSGGGGSLLRHRLTITQVTLRRNESGISGLTNWSNGSTTPILITRSRHCGPSPIMLPSAHTACSHTFWCGDLSKRIKCSTEPASTTAWVWCEEPEAILVSAQAASNCSVGWSSLVRQSTKMGSMLASIIWSIGGFLSLDKSFLEEKSKKIVFSLKELNFFLFSLFYLADWTALSFTFGSGLSELMTTSVMDACLCLPSSSESILLAWLSSASLAAGMFLFFCTVSSFLV